MKPILLNAPFLLLAFALSFQSNFSFAQVVPDSTLPVNSTVTPSGNTSAITGGTVRGFNLFHSFQNFSVPTGGTAYFNNAADIQNIFARITGGSISRIDGLIKANGSANFFLINPNGIVFGPNASLTIGGSFLASTANAIKFADDSEFSATNPQATPLLTVSVPIGLQLGENSGKIEVFGTGNQLRYGDDFATIRSDRPDGLRVQPGKTLSLIGGEISLEGGNLTAEGGRIELIALNNGMLPFGASDRPAIANPATAPANLGNIHLSRAASLDASGSGGGDVLLQANSILLSEGSVILANTLGSQPGGSVTLQAADSVILTDTNPLDYPSSLLSEVNAGASGNGGDILVESKRLILQNGAVISSATFGTGNGGNVAIAARESAELKGLSSSGLPSFLLSEANMISTGAAGTLTIETGRLSVEDGAIVSAATAGSGKGGSLIIKASASVEVQGTSADGSFSSGLITNTTDTANAGNLSIAANQLLIRDGAAISVSSTGSGSAGNLEVTAGEIWLESGGTLEAIAVSGAGGNLNLQAQQLQLRSGSKISTDAGAGNGGNIAIAAQTLIALENSDITANALAGFGGRVLINSQGIFGTQFQLFQTPNSDVTATGASPALSGTVQIQTPRVNASSAIVDPRDRLVDVAALIATNSCAASRDSSFIITGRGGLPADPTEALASGVVWRDLPPLSDEKTSVSVVNSSEARRDAGQFLTKNPEKIVEANGWAFTSDGKVVLTASAIESTSYNPWLTSPRCNQW